MDEKYSVLMSVYGKENPLFFRQSIQSMMNQTLPFSDFVLVMDGPVSGELEKVVAWAAQELQEKFQCIRLERNFGLGYALQKGLMHCKYSIVVRMDSDDISRPTRCEKQIKILQEGNYSIVGAGLREFVKNPEDTPNCRILPETDEAIRKFMKKRNPFNHPCVMYRKEDVLAAGNYQEFPGFEDYYLWVRMLQNGCRGYNLQEILLDMRTGNGMYARRGGLSYMKTLVKFQLFLKKSGVIGVVDFLKNCGVRIAVSIISEDMRKKFYKVFLRKKYV